MQILTPRKITSAASVMSVNAGTFTHKTSTGTQAYTGVGFVPKVLLVAGRGSTAAEVTAKAHQINHIGFATSATNRASIGWSDEDNQATTDSDRTHRSTNIINEIWNDAILNEADLDSFDADGFTLDYTVSNASAQYNTYLALGGSAITNANIVTFQAGNAVESVAVTGVGFQPDIVIIMGVAGNSALPYTSTSAIIMLGATDGTNQWAMSNQSLHGNGTSNSYRAFNTSNCIYRKSASGTLKDAASIVSLDADGFTLNVTSADQDRQFSALCIKGGQWEVGNGTSKTSTGTKNYTTGFQPEGVIIASAGTTVDAAASAGCLGFSDTSNDAAVSFYAADNQATSIAERSLSNDHAYNIFFNGVLSEEAAVSAVSASNFTLNFTTAIASALKFGWIVCAS